MAPRETKRKVSKGKGKRAAEYRLSSFDGNSGSSILDVMGRVCRF